MEPGESPTNSIFLHNSIYPFNTVTLSDSKESGKFCSSFATAKGDILSKTLKNRVGGHPLFEWPTSHTTAHAVPQAAVPKFTRYLAE